MLSDINNLINIRDFLYRANENAMVKMTPEQSSKVSRKISAIDKTLLGLIVEIDLEQISSDLGTKKTKVQATQEIQSVNQMDEIVKESLSGMKTKLEDLKKVVKK